MHISVLLEESVNYLNIKSNGVYVDATMGYGGHSKRILSKLKQGDLYCFDKDDFAINYCQKELADYANCHIIKADFRDIKEKLAKEEIEKIDGIIYDLGVSSVQLDTTDRGFSFHNDAKLDMRMDQSKDFSAYDVVNNYSYEELRKIFYNYGEEKYSSSIAQKIVEYRNKKKIETTLELVDIIKTGMPAIAMRQSHPARRIFQAIRIEVNDELGALEKSLNDALSILNVSGRISVITFHSLEEKVVKEIFKKYTTMAKELSSLPFVPEHLKPKYKIIAKKVLPTVEETTANRRSRSAKLFVIERISD